MRKLIAVILMLCIFTAMATGTAAAAKSSGKLTQTQTLQAAGLSLNVAQLQENSAFYTPVIAGATVTQATFAKAKAGVILSAQQTKIKLVL